jgi:Queuosine biosynthesis protein QueC
MAFQPSANVGMLVGGVIVDDGVDCLARGYLLLDDIEEANELLMATALHVAADHRAVEDVHRGEQRRRAVALVVVRHRPGPALLHGESGLCAIKRLNLAFFVDRQHDGVCGRLDIEPDDVAQFVDEARVVGQLELAHPMRLQTMARQMRWTELTLSPAAFAIRTPVQWVVSPGGSPSLSATTRSAVSAPSGLMRERRVLSRSSPSTPSSIKRSCQRQTQVLDFPVRLMISFVPTPSAVNSTIKPRQTLFSGGIDSLSGAVDVLSAGASVALVSHRSSPKIYGHQKQLVAALKQRFPKRLMHIPVLVTRQQPLTVQEHTQRSRSFLYAALACGIARLLGTTHIRFFENGVVSINLPISGQVVGARATRTTHPLVLKRFREFFSAAVSKPLEVENPFIWKTKADVTRSIVEHGCGPLMKHTVSCTRSRDITRSHTHCGCCSQCLDRRFAVLAANAADHDPVEMYKVELLTGERRTPKDQTMAESYTRTALELRDLDELGFFGRF